MHKSKRNTRAEIKAAKKKFVKTMRHFYPNFTEKLWARTGYRETHPQRVILTQ